MKSIDRQTPENYKGGEKYFTVHADMLMDILQVVTSNDILFEIKSVDMDESSVLLYIPKKGQSNLYAKAVENIEVMLSEYRDYARLLL